METDATRGELWRFLEAQHIQPMYRDERSVLLSAAQVREGIERWKGSRTAATGTSFP
jgi:hypothetical protein